MDIAQDTLDRIGQPESELLEYKAVLPPAATVAQLICAFANTKGGAIVLGVVDDGKEILINGLSDEFRAVQITRKAIDLLSPPPVVSYDYVVHQGKRLFVIEVQKSSVEVSLGGKIYVRTGDRTTLKQPAPVKRSSERRHRPPVEDLAGGSQILHRRKSEAAGPLRKRAPHPRRPRQAPVSRRVRACRPTMPEGKMLMRILFSSCADTFETFMSDLLYEIYLAKPETLKSDAPVTVKDVLDCSDMQEFITRYAKEKLKKLQRGSVKGFIADNQAIKSLNVFDETRTGEIEKILQIRHLYTHQNGIVDDKFRQFFPAHQGQRRIPHDAR